MAKFFKTNVKSSDKDLNKQDETVENIINTELSLTEQDENVVSDVQKQIMAEELCEFSPIKQDDINISTVYIFDDKDELEAKIYFRNGLSKKVNFEYVPLVIVNSKNEIVAQKTFDLREMGDIPSCSARPWKLCFDKSIVDMNKFSPQDCKVVFDSRIKAVNYAHVEYEDFPKDLINFKSQLQGFLNELPRLEHDRLSISTYNIVLQKEGKLIITLVVRNTADKPVKIDKLPITVRDENDNIAAAGEFNLNDFVVNSMKAKICNLAFETNLNVEDTIVMNKFKVSFER